MGHPFRKARILRGEAVVQTDSVCRSGARLLR